MPLGKHPSSDEVTMSSAEKIDLDMKKFHFVIKMLQIIEDPKRDLADVKINNSYLSDLDFIQVLEENMTPEIFSEISDDVIAFQCSLEGDLLPRLIALKQSKNIGFEEATSGSMGEANPHLGRPKKELTKELATYEEVLKDYASRILMQYEQFLKERYKPLETSADVLKRRTGFAALALVCGTAGYMLNDKVDGFEKEDERSALLEKSHVSSTSNLGQFSHNFENTSYIFYTIKRGDTLSDIAELNRLDYFYLAAFNGVSNPDLIIEGEEIKIPLVSKETN